MDEDEFEQMRSPMVNSANGWTLDAPDAGVRGYFWVISPGFPEDPAMVHFWGGFVRHYGDQNATPVDNPAMKGCLWNGPVAAPKPPEIDRNAIDPIVTDASLKAWIDRAAAMTAAPFAGTHLEPVQSLVDFEH